LLKELGKVPVPPELLAVAVFFLLSLGGAWVLFKWLSSTAGITKKEYQLGGAAAGCLILFSALYGAYYHLVGLKLEDLQAQLKACKGQRDVDESELHIMGSVSPAPKKATLVLVAKAIPLPDSGRFDLPVKGLDFKKAPPSFYVMDATQFWYNQSFPEDNPSNLTINLQPER
jgi:hypothetical protein